VGKIRVQSFSTRNFCRQSGSRISSLWFFSSFLQFIPIECSERHIFQSHKVPHILILTSHIFNPPPRLKELVHILQDENQKGKMAPIAVDTSPTTNGSSTLKATARSFHPTGTPDASRYHASSSSEAIEVEAKYAAHNYHPLPVVFSKAQGVSVWDPVSSNTSRNVKPSHKAIRRISTIC
jgi:hypothetical protein